MVLALPAAMSLIFAGESLLSQKVMSIPLGGLLAGLVVTIGGSLFLPSEHLQDSAVGHRFELRLVCCLGGHDSVNVVVYRFAELAAHGCLEQVMGLLDCEAGSRIAPGA